MKSVATILATLFARCLFPCLIWLIDGAGLTVGNQEDPLGIGNHVHRPAPDGARSPVGHEAGDEINFKSCSSGLVERYEDHFVAGLKGVTQEPWWRNLLALVVNRAA